MVVTAMVVTAMVVMVMVIMVMATDMATVADATGTVAGTAMA